MREPPVRTYALYYVIELLELCITCEYYMTTKEMGICIKFMNHLQQKNV